MTLCFSMLHYSSNKGVEQTQNKIPSTKLKRWNSMTPINSCRLNFVTGFWRNCTNGLSLTSPSFTSFNLFPDIIIAFSIVFSSRRILLLYPWVFQSNAFRPVLELVQTISTYCFWFEFQWLPYLFCTLTFYWKPNLARRYLKPFLYICVRTQLTRVTFLAL